MSDMALVDWQRKSARRILPLVGRPTTMAGALRLATKYPLLLAVVLVAGLVCVALAVLPSEGSHPSKAPPVPAAVAPVSTWFDIIKPIEIFSVEAADLAKSNKIYKARRSIGGGGRQDTLAFGLLAGDEPSLHLTLYRRGTEAYAPGPIFADMVRLAADAGLSVVRSGLPDLMPTRFGQFQVAAVALSASGAPALPCSGFRLILDKPALTMTGLACGGKAAAALTRERLGCALERLDLTSGGGDQPLVEFFASTELKRNAACAGMRLGPDIGHPAWLDDRSATPRKNVRHR